MNEFLENSLFAGVTISLLAYMAGAFLKKKFKNVLSQIKSQIILRIVRIFLNLLRKLVITIQKVEVILQMMEKMQMFYLRMQLI